MWLSDKLFIHELGLKYHIPDCATEFLCFTPFIWKYHKILFPKWYFYAFVQLFQDQRPYLLVSHSAFKQLQTIKYGEVTQGSKRNFVLNKKNWKTKK